MPMMDDAANGKMQRRTQESETETVTAVKTVVVDWVGERRWRWHLHWLHYHRLRLHYHSLLGWRVVVVDPWHYLDFDVHKVAEVVVVVLSV